MCENLETDRQSNRQTKRQTDGQPITGFQKAHLNISFGK